VQDEIIIEAVQRGDRDAFASIVERFHGAVYGYLRARLLEPADAEDLTQEVFLRCCQGKARFDSSAMILPWLVGVVGNVLREHIRKMIRRHEVAWTELCLALDGRNQDETSMYGEAVHVSSPGGPAAWSGRKTSRRDE